MIEGFIRNIVRENSLSTFMCQICSKRTTLENLCTMRGLSWQRKKNSDFLRYITTRKKREKKKSGFSLIERNSIFHGRDMTWEHRNTGFLFRKWKSSLISPPPHFSNQSRKSHLESKPSLSVCFMFFFVFFPFFLSSLHKGEPLEISFIAFHHPTPTEINTW